jgi:hypothetical protein
MSDVVIAFLFSLGAGAWIYSKMYRSTGGLTQNALVVAGGAALLLFLAALTFLKAIFS